LIILVIIPILLVDFAVFLFSASYLRLSSTQLFRMKETDEKHASSIARFIERRNYYATVFHVSVIIFISATQLIFAAASDFDRGSVLLRLVWGFCSIMVVYVAANLVSAGNPERTFVFSLPLMQFLSYLLFPLVYPVSLAAAAFKAPPQAEENREEEIEAFLDEGQREGIIEKEESELIRGIMEFSETVVREVMTPRIDVVTIKDSSTLDEALSLFAKCRHTRLPVFESHADNIIGALWVKDILAPAISKDKQRIVKEFVRPVSFVPENKRISDLLKEFQEQREQMAIIVDEYGGVDGLVTTEDLVEEIVGEIEERGEAEGEFIKALPDGTIEAKGRASLGDLSEAIGIEITEGDYDSVAGWISTRLGTIPVSGQTFELDGLKVEIVAADRKRIHRVKISTIGKISEKP
jgi:putative hemolysin